MGKIVCEVMIGGSSVVKVVTTAAGANVGQLVKTLPGVGKPFWYWSALPAGKVIGADFTGAPIVDTDVAVNNTNIQAITADPADVLIFESV
jgi:hypothetical protein